MSMDECELSEEHKIMLMVQAYSVMTAIGASEQNITEEERSNARAAAPLIAQRLFELLGAK